MYVFIGATDLLRSAVTEQQEYAASLESSIDALHKVGCSSSSFGFVLLYYSHNTGKRTGIFSEK